MTKQKQLDRQREQQEAKARRQAQELPARTQSVEDVLAALRESRSKPVVRLRDMVADEFVKQSRDEGLFALASVFSGLEEQAGYFARHAFQLARNSMEVRRLGWVTPGGEHDQWCKQQAAKGRQ